MRQEQDSFNREVVADCLCAEIEVMPGFGNTRKRSGKESRRGMAIH